MNTKEVANTWWNMCKEGKHLECVNELYAETVVCREMPGMPGEITDRKNKTFGTRVKNG